MARKRTLETRLALAGGILAAGIFAIASAAELGDVQLGAGEMKISVEKGEQGIRMGIAPRQCPPRCGFDISWSALTR